MTNAQLPDNNDLLAMAQRWAARLYPDFALKSISLKFHGVDESVRLLAKPSASVCDEMPEEKIFIPNAVQVAILEALSGKALRTGALVRIVGNQSQLFRKPGGIQELIDQGRVKHHDRLGYYRPDAPPEELRSRGGT